jgi:diguanylate cyclase (GGDEF)-like protein
MCLLVCVGAWVSTKLSFAVATVSSIWIGNGIVAAFTLTAPRGRKIPFFVAGLLAGMAVDLAQGETFYPAVWFALCNSSEVLVAVLALRHIDGRPAVTNKRILLRMAVFGIILGPLICAVLAAPAVGILEGRPFLEAARIWFLAGALGEAATLPVLLLLLTPQKRAPQKRSILAADVALATLLVAVAAALFWQTRYPLLFLLFPPLIVALYRFGLPGAVYGASVVVMLAAAFTAEGHGPFALAHGVNATERVTLFQIFGFVVFTSCVPLGFSIEERRRLEDSLKEANRKLGDLALLDSLTGVRNRRSFDAVMDSEWSLARSTGSDLSLVYLDVDFFKRFNDTYGHQQGDECLRAVVGTLIASVRGSGDCVARYGGEEFVVLLPSTSADSARAVADRIASTILGLRIPHKESPFGIVTASIGIATVWPSGGGDPDALIRMADEALYAAKRGGRDRIETISEPGHLLGV